MKAASVPDYVTKPLEIAPFLRAIDEVLASKN